MEIFLVAGARPNFMKIAPLVHQLKSLQAGKPTSEKMIRYKLVHTGQHYDYEMSKVFFEELDIPEPDYFLDAGSGSHAEQTAKVMMEFEKVCLEEKPDVVVVVGDVNSTMACSVTAKKLQIKVAHVEAGLRSHDLTMPEEINRIVTDSISDYLFVTEKSGLKNLQKEGRKKEHIFFVGNIMIDTLFYGLKKLANWQADKLKSSKYAVVTLHRPSNVDEKDKLKDILSALKEISNDMDVYFPVHPRTEKNIKKYKLRYLFKNSSVR